MENMRILDACNGYIAVDRILAAVICLYKVSVTVTWHKFKVSYRSLSARTLALVAVPSVAAGLTMKMEGSLR